MFTFIVIYVRIMASSVWSIKMKVEVIQSERRTVSIKIKDGKVIVRAPIGMGQQEIEKIVLNHKDWIKKTLVIEKEARENREPELSEKEIKALKKAARVYFTEKCKYYSEIMGLTYNRITITSARTRFGSCSSEKSISFSYRLMLYPETAREYVVVHELAHLLEMNHSKKFYTIVEKYLPNYRERRKLLKK